MFKILVIISLLISSYCGEVEFYLKKNQQNSSSKCLRQSIDLYSSMNTKALDQMLKSLRNHSSYFTYVSDARLRATFYLSQAALMLSSEGDFVETGIPEPIETENLYGSKKRKGTYANSQEIFENNIRWGLWNDSIIRISKGWFNETLPVSKVQKIRFLRLDGDIYISTKDALDNLYKKVVPGGYIYIDDFGSFQGCRDAVDEFRFKHKIYETMYHIREKRNNRYIHFEAVYWQKRYQD